MRLRVGSRCFTEALTTGRSRVGSGKESMRIQVVSTFGRPVNGSAQSCEHLRVRRLTLGSATLPASTRIAQEGSCLPKLETLSSEALNAATQVVAERVR